MEWVWLGSGGYPRPDWSRLIPYAVSSALFGGFDVAIFSSAYMSPPKFEFGTKHLSNLSHLSLVPGDAHLNWVGPTRSISIRDGMAWSFGDDGRYTAKSFKEVAVLKTLGEPGESNHGMVGMRVLCGGERKVYVYVEDTRWAKLETVESAMQFCLETVAVKEEDLCIVLDDKMLVNWIMGEKEVAWDQTFIRNRAKALETLFLNASVMFKKTKEFKRRLEWEAMSRSKDEAWVSWQTGEFA
ncbi:hypothetical protein PIB30_056684 [Stylosanthes scabra]|uniref:RNase H type-1 domain-containing protein n=1 Tax=Stylosanthes scabra TaxID=79078 RepID=A0ABU6ZI42_9FABA|nr:hypothetical protein [Stylosanthes scabra]